MEEKWVDFTFPKDAESLVPVKELIESLKSDVSFNNFSGVTKKLVSSYQVCDCDYVEMILDNLLAAKIPFDVDISETIDNPQTHYRFRDNMEKPYVYYGEPAVSVSLLRDIIANDPDYTREHLIEYLDAQFPEIEPIDKAIKNWVEKNVSRDVSR